MFGEEHVFQEWKDKFCWNNDDGLKFGQKQQFRHTPCQLTSPLDYEILSTGPTKEMQKWSNNMYTKRYVFKQDYERRSILS